LSSDKTVAIIDGSGVLADPAGLNREELVRLAKLRIPVSNFDTSKLGSGGYLVKVEDNDVKLPCKQPHWSRFVV
jgi:glutamate dehydrogenase